MTIGVFDISIVDISTLLKNIDIDMVVLENIDIAIDISQNCLIDIDIFQNCPFDIDIDIFQNHFIDIFKI